MPYPKYDQRYTPNESRWKKKHYCRKWKKKNVWMHVVHVGLLQLGYLALFLPVFMALCLFQEFSGHMLTHFQSSKCTSVLSMTPPLMTSPISDRTHSNVMSMFSKKEVKGTDFLVIDGNQGNKVTLNAT